MVAQKSSGFTLVYPGLSTGRVSFQWWESRALHAPRRKTPHFLSGLGSLAIRGFLRWLPRTSEMTMARGHSRRSRFEEFPAAIANWCSCMKFNPASYDIFIDVLFCQVQQVQWISELHIGAPVSMDVICRVPLFKFPWSSRVVISGASLSWSTQHVLLKHHVLEFIHIFDICRGDSSWTPMSQCEEWEKCFYALNHHLSNSAMRILINSYQFYVLKGVSSGVRSAQANAPDGTRGYGELAGQTPLGCGGPQALQCPPVAQGCQLQRIYPLVI